MLPAYSEDLSQLPSYESSIYIEGELRCKQEYSNPFKENVARRWVSCHATLNNTALHLKFRGVKQNKVLSMQYAQVGFAGDYRKGHYPIRVRANGMQFLFEMPSAFELVRWIQAIRLSIDIALPLDLREMPPEKYHTTRSQQSGRKLSVTSRSEKEPLFDSLVTDAVSIASSACSSQSNNYSNHSVLICEEDMPANVYFDMKDFGFIFKKDTWEGRRWLIGAQWAMVTDNCIYSY